MEESAPTLLRIGVFDHLGWAVAVTASADHAVVDRRRIALIEPGTAPMPVHHGIERLNDPAALALIARVRAAAVRATSAALAEIDDALPAPVASISLRTWPADFPQDLATLRRPPYDSRADAVMYRQVIAEIARRRGWKVALFDATQVEAQASAILTTPADALLRRPRRILGPPWNRDHRIALAATIVAA